MDLITEHRKARTNTVTLLHEFKLRYKKNSKVIYGFVEGKEDPCFYRGFLENNIPDSWRTELFTAGNKDKVIEIYSKIDWMRFKRNQVLFFVDKDLSFFTNEQVPNDAFNFYITDNYSIENNIVTANTCDRVLRELCGFSDLSYEDSELLSSLFNKQLLKFQRALIPVMAFIIQWRKNSKKAHLNNISMKELFEFKAGRLIRKRKPAKCKNLIFYIHEQCDVDIAEREVAIEFVKKFYKNELFKKFIRGKYLIWFFVEYCLSINRDYKKLSMKSIRKKPKMTVTLSQANGVAQIAPRCRIPITLQSFFDKTVKNYVKSLMAT